MTIDVHRLIDQKNVHINLIDACRETLAHSNFVIWFCFDIFFVWKKSNASVKGGIVRVTAHTLLTCSNIDDLRRMGEKGISLHFNSIHLNNLRFKLHWFETKIKTSNVCYITKHINYLTSIAAAAAIRFESLFKFYTK